MPAQRLRQKQAVRRDRADVKQGLGDGRHDIRAQAPPDRHGGIASAEQGQVALCRGRPWRLSRPHLAPQGRRRHYARACRRAGGAEFEPGDIVRWFRQRDNIAHPQRVAPAAAVPVHPVLMSGVIGKRQICRGQAGGGRSSPAAVAWTWNRKPSWLSRSHSKRTSADPAAKRSGLIATARGSQESPSRPRLRSCQ